MDMLNNPLVRFVAGRFGVTPDILRYARAWMHAGEPAEVSVPGELLPIAYRMAARGLVNNTLLPILHASCILPYWAECQLDPRNPGFMARGLSLMAINATYRNWTALGLPGHAAEAIVDPRGLVTPWYDGWSLDTWLLPEEGDPLIPSRAAPDIPGESKGIGAGFVEQTLVDSLPIVVTRFIQGTITLTLESYVTEEGGRPWLVHGATVQTSGPVRRGVVLFFAVRPFNPEGISPVEHVALGHQVIEVHGYPAVFLPRPPDVGSCASLRTGDVDLRRLDPRARAATDAGGLCTAVVGYRIDIEPGAAHTVTVLAPVYGLGESPIRGQPPSVSPQWRLRVQERWRAAQATRLRMQLPDGQLQASFDANAAHLLTLYDGDEITPGPYTYHHFWFRDAAYMVAALVRLGYLQEARRILRTYPRRQRRDGFFISQNGEWDANGQAIWTLVEYFRLTGDRALLAEVYPAIARGAYWIERKRQATRRGPVTPHYGLLPAGFSAEHFGPNDYYFWDDFWGLAGLRDAAVAAQALGYTADAQAFRAMQEAFWDDVERALLVSQDHIGRPAMATAPLRPFDSSAVGTLVALWPLALMTPDDPRLVETVDALREVCFLEDALYHDVGHSALGTYLTMHVAHCLLLRGSAEAWPIVHWLLRNATSTWTWPEGIHPVTRGGCMGDGHHGWALADWLLLLRDIVVVEQGERLLLAPILPAEWAIPGNEVVVTRALTQFGLVDYRLSFDQEGAELLLEAAWRRPPQAIEVTLPYPLRCAIIDGVEQSVSGQRATVPATAHHVRLAY